MQDYEDQFTVKVLALSYLVTQLDKVVYTRMILISSGLTGGGVVG